MAKLKYEIKAVRVKHKTKEKFQMLWQLFEIIQLIQFFCFEKHLDGACDKIQKVLTDKKAHGRVE